MTAQEFPTPSTAGPLVIFSAAGFCAITANATPWKNTTKLDDVRNRTAKRPELLFQKMTITAKRFHCLSRFLIHHLYQRLGISKTISKPLFLAGVSIDLGHMVGHQHPVVSNFLVGADGADKIYVPVVRESLLKIQEATFNVSEMHIENLPA